MVAEAIQSAVPRTVAGSERKFGVLRWRGCVLSVKVLASWILGSTLIIYQMLDFSMVVVGKHFVFLLIVV